MAIVLLATLALAADGFEDRAAAVLRELEPLRAAAQARGLAGDAAGANGDLVLWADKAGTPEAWFVVGNMLWSGDRERSLALHQKAFAALPTEPLVNLEWAMELHRAGRCAEAIPAYELYVAYAAGADVPPLWALTHCKLVIGDIDGALATFERVSPRNSHVEAEAMFADVFSPYDAFAVRARLLAAARGGDHAAWIEVLDNDLSFRRDLWNVDANPALVTLDVEEARRALVNQPDLLADLNGMVGADSGDAGAAKQLVSRYPKQLPTGHILAEAVLRAAVQARSPERVGKAYEKDLKRRAKAGDVGAVDLLLSLPSDEAEQVALDKIACDAGLHHACVSGLLSGKNSEIDALVARFPHDVRFRTLSLLPSLRAGAPSEQALVAWLVEAPRWMYSSVAWVGALQVLAAVRANRPTTPVTLQMLETAVLGELPAPAPKCAPWEPKELVSGPFCQQVR